MDAFVDGILTVELSERTGLVSPEHTTQILRINYLDILSQNYQFHQKFCENCDLTMKIRQKLIKMPDKSPSEVLEKFQSVFFAKSLFDFFEVDQYF